MGGTGGILYLFEDHWYKFEARIGRETNNIIDMKALRLMLQMTLLKRIQKLQVFGDSLLVICWLILKKPQKNIILKPRFKDIFHYMGLF